MTEFPTVRSLLIDAAREFNSGRYFEAHEILEDGMEAVPDHLWALVVGLIQIAVGYHKVTQRLYQGAVTMLTRGIEKVDAHPPDAIDLHLARLRQRVCTDLEALRSGRFDAVAFTANPPRLQLRR